jgi:hypothetical protein
MAAELGEATAKNQAESRASRIARASEISASRITIFLNARAAATPENGAANRPASDAEALA